MIGAWKIAIGLAMTAGFCPWARAWYANPRTTLRSAVVWGIIAWTAWTVTVFASVEAPCSPWLPFLALCLTGCAGVAVLGARRPGEGAWNFVVIGLLAILVFPATAGLGAPRIETMLRLFLATILLVPLLNYSPTRLGPAVPLCAIAFGTELLPELDDGWIWLGRGALTLAPWVGLLAIRACPPKGDFESVWLGFRDGFGFLWAQRVREQFNRSAANSGEDDRLDWSGLKSRQGKKEEPLARLQAVLQRFRYENQAQ